MSSLDGKGFAVLGLLFALGCGGPSLRGALSIENGREPAGAGQLTPMDCRDERGAPANAPELRVQRVRLEYGQDAVLERRPGYDTVMVTNGYDDAYGRVFQYISDDGHHHRILHTLRMTPGLAGSRLVLASAFDLQGSESEFRATTRKASLECELVLIEPAVQPAGGVTAPPPAG